MARKIIILVMFCLIFGLTNAVFAAQSVGVVANEIGEADPSMIDIPMKLWLNREFVLLDRPISNRKDGYRQLVLASDNYTHPTFSSLYGKTLKAVKIDEKYPIYTITFLDTVTNTSYKAEILSETVDYMALADDLTKAKEHWLNKTIYPKQRTLSTYDQTTEKYGNIPITYGSAVKVVDICWGFYEDNPLWLIVQTPDGKQGFISTAFSWTNIEPTKWTKERPWEKDFFETNPRTLYNWSNAIWQLIDQGQLQLGMTAEQVKFSWGEPDRINIRVNSDGISEQWVYESYGHYGYLYIENNILASIHSN